MSEVVANVTQSLNGEIIEFNVKKSQSISQESGFDYTLSVTLKLAQTNNSPAFEISLPVTKRTYIELMETLKHFNLSTDPCAFNARTTTTNEATQEIKISLWCRSLAINPNPFAVSKEPEWIPVPGVPTVFVNEEVQKNIEFLYKTDIYGFCWSGKTADIVDAEYKKIYWDNKQLENAKFHINNILHNFMKNNIGFESLKSPYYKSLLQISNLVSLFERAKSIRDNDPSIETALKWEYITE